jgi:pimeloyl-ACP methyl ester carboxylesterase
MPGDAANRPRGVGETYDRAMRADLTTMTTPDGRQLEYLVTGPAEGPTLLFHSGMPSPAADFSCLTGPAARLGLRTISYSRPGYGRSTGRAGRSVADAVEDVTTLLNELGVTEFHTLGWSAGGPHAVACAALLSDRCQAATLLASLAPYAARDLDFLAGMEDIEDWNAAIGGFDELDAFLRPLLGDFQQATAASVREDFDNLLSSADKAALTDTFADELANVFRRAVETGIDGWRDDALAFVKHWGFAVSEITVPVAVWHGRQDRLVPFAHGEWLAAEIPDGEFHPLDPDGHLSLTTQMDTILANLFSLRGSPPTSRTSS